MLIDLHNAISKVCPIVGLADLGGGNYRIDFADNATPEQQAAAWQMTKNFQLAEPPKWDDFRSRIVIEAGYLRIVSSSNFNQTLNDFLVAIFWQIGENPGLLSEAARIWNQMVKNVWPLATEVANFKKIALECRMPFDVNDRGEFVLKT